VPTRSRSARNGRRQIEKDRKRNRAGMEPLPVQIGGRERSMADDKSKVGNSDRDRINVHESYEVRDWAEKFGVSHDELKAAVREVGPMAADVARKLGRSL
jgi:hypothetical protein